MNYYFDLAVEYISREVEEICDLVPGSLEIVDFSHLFISGFLPETFLSKGGGSTFIITDKPMFPLAAFYFNNFAHIKGVFEKSKPPSLIIKEICKSMSISGEGKTMRAQCKAPCFTVQEVYLLGQFLQGRSASEISKKLGVDNKKIHNQKQYLLKKMGVRKINVLFTGVRSPALP